MIGSGSDDNCIPQWFAPHCKLREVDRGLCDVQGGEIQTFGTRSLLIDMESAEEDIYRADTVDLVCDFVCCSTAHALFSFVKLMRAGAGFEVKDRRMLLDARG